MGGANEVLDETKPQRISTIDRALDLVVDALQADDALVRLVGDADRIGAWVPYPPPDLTPSSFLLMVCPFTGTEEQGPGVILASFDIQIIFRFPLPEAQRKRRGSASYETVRWEIRRVLMSPGVHLLYDDTAKRSLARHSYALPAPAATPMQGPKGWVYDISQPWHFGFVTDPDTGLPFGLMA